MTYPTISPKLTLDFANSRQLDPRITFTRTSTATYLHPDTGLITTAPDGVARFEKEGLLIEESRTNIQLNSAAPYSSGGSQIVWTTGLTAPDGTSTAVKLAATAVDTVHNMTANIYPSSFPSGTYTYSMYAKSDGLNRFNIKGANLTVVTFDLSTGTVVGGAGGTITPAGNGWYRCSITESTTNNFYQYNITLNADNETGSAPFLGDGTSGIIVWGWQMEAGSFPTSYIPTAGSTVTRAADVASITGTNFSNWYNQSEGTLLQSFVPKGSNVTYAGRLYQNSTNYTGSYINPITRIVHMYRTPTAENVLLKTGVYVNTKVNLGMSYDAVGFSGCHNGTAVQTSSSITGTQSTLTQLLVGGGTQHISRLTYYDRRVSDASLQDLTS